MGKQAASLSLNRPNCGFGLGCWWFYSSGQWSKFDRGRLGVVWTATWGRENDKGKAIINYFKCGELGHISTYCRKQTMDMAKNTPVDDDDDIWKQLMMVSWWSGLRIMKKSLMVMVTMRWSMEMAVGPWLVIYGDGGWSLVIWKTSNSEGTRVWLALNQCFLHHMHTLR